MNLKSAAEILLDDKRVDEVEVQILQTCLLLEYNDIGHLLRHHRPIVCTGGLGNVIALAVYQSDLI